MCVCVCVCVGSRSDSLWQLSCYLGGSVLFLSPFSPPSCRHSAVPVSKQEVIYISASSRVSGPICLLSINRHYTVFLLAVNGRADISLILRWPDLLPFFFFILWLQHEIKPELPSSLDRNNRAVNWLFEVDVCSVRAPSQKHSGLCACRQTDDNLC